MAGPGFSFRPHSGWEGGGSSRSYCVHPASRGALEPPFLPTPTSVWGYRWPPLGRLGNKQVCGLCTSLVPGFPPPHADGISWFSWWPPSPLPVMKPLVCCWLHAGHPPTPQWPHVFPSKEGRTHPLPCYGQQGDPGVEDTPHLVAAHKCYPVSHDSHVSRLPRHLPLSPQLTPRLTEVPPPTSPGTDPPDPVLSCESRVFAAACFLRSVWGRPWLGSQRRPLCAHLLRPLGSRPLPASLRVSH